MAGDDDGYIHDLLLYSSDEELLSEVGSFLAEGVSRSEPTILAVTPATRRLLESAVDDLDEVLVLDNVYRRPAEAMERFRTAPLPRSGRMRVIGEVPHPGIGGDWEPWAAYEAVANQVLAKLPLWGLCIYDTRTLPPELLHDVTATHPNRVDRGVGRVRNDAYLPPEEFLRHRPSRPDPLEDLPPSVELSPLKLPGDLRRAVRRVLEERGASGSVGTDFVLALSEIATNALVHGGPPVEARVWVGPDRLHAVVSDNGPGPDPLVGYLPVSPSPGGGIGLRLARQLTDHLAVDTRGRCVVRVTSILH